MSKWTGTLQKIIYKIYQAPNTHNVQIIIYIIVPYNLLPKTPNDKFF